MKISPLGKRLGFFTVLVLIIAIVVGIYPAYVEINNISLLLLSVFICLLIGAWFLLYSKKNGAFTLRYVDAVWIYVIFMVILGFAALVHPDYRNMLSAIKYPTAGILSFLIMGALFVVLLNLRLTAKELLVLAGSLTALVAIGSGFYALQLINRLNIQNTFFGTEFTPFVNVIPFSYALLALGVGAAFVFSKEVSKNRLIWISFPFIVAMVAFASFLILNTYDLSFEILTPSRIIISLIVIITIGGLGFTSLKRMFANLSTLALFVGTLVLSLAITFYINSIKGNFETLANFGIAAMPISYSWDVTVDALSSNVQTLFTGIGPGIDDIVYIRYRTLEMFRNVAVPQNGFIWIGPFVNTILISFGLLGLLGFVAVLVFVIKQILMKPEVHEENKYGGLYGGLAIASVILSLGTLVIPAPVTYFILTILVLALTFNLSYLIYPETEKTVTLKLSAALDEGPVNKYKFSGFLEIIVGIVGLTAVVLVTSIYIKYLLAEKLYIETVNERQVSGTSDYTSINKAISMVDDIRYLKLRNSFLYEELVAALEKDAENSSIPVIVDDLIEGTEALVEKYPIDYSAWEFRGDVYRSLNNFAEDNPYAYGAINAYNQSLSLNPLNIRLRFTLSEFYTQVGSYEEAYMLYTDLAQTFPELTYEVGIGLTNLYVNIGNFDEATKTVTELATLVDKAVANGSISEETASSLKTNLSNMLSQIEQLKLERETKSAE